MALAGGAADQGRRCQIYSSKLGRAVSSRAPTAPLLFSLATPMHRARDRRRWERAKRKHSYSRNIDIRVWLREPTDQVRLVINGLLGKAIYFFITIPLIVSSIFLSLSQQGQQFILRVCRACSCLKFAVRGNILGWGPVYGPHVVGRILQAI